MRGYSFAIACAMPSALLLGCVVSGGADIGEVTAASTVADSTGPDSGPMREFPDPPGTGRAECVDEERPHAGGGAATLLAKYEQRFFVSQLEEPSLLQVHLERLPEPFEVRAAAIPFRQRVRLRFERLGDAPKDLDLDVWASVAENQFDVTTVYVHHDGSRARTITQTCRLVGALSQPTSVYPVLQVRGTHSRCIASRQGASRPSLERCTTSNAQHFTVTPRGRLRSTLTGQCIGLEWYAPPGSRWPSRKRPAMVSCAEPSPRRGETATAFVLGPEMRVQSTMTGRCLNPNANGLLVDCRPPLLGWALEPTGELRNSPGSVTEACLVDGNKNPWFARNGLAYQPRVSGCAPSESPWSYTELGQLRLGDRCLDVTSEGAAALSACGDAAGQRWLLRSRISADASTMLLQDGQTLNADTNPQLWELTPVATESR
jgi:hypothetical protein